LLEILQSSTYRRWFERLRDRNAKARIDARIRRLSLGNLGDVRRLGGSVSELRIDYGPGYRVYFTQRGARVLLLLCGGDKRSQQSDIVRAREISSEWT
jgi:putative addiction module killer protein